jgi:transposase InsO family protein
MRVGAGRPRRVQNRRRVRRTRSRVATARRRREAAIIETWRRHCDEVRPHSSLGYSTPTEFREKHVVTNNQIRTAVF